MTDRGRYAGKIITDDDATIAAALEDVSIPTLLLSMIHMSGDTSILDDDLRPAGIYLNEVHGFMSPEDQAEVRARALDVIKAYRDGGSVLPAEPDAATLHRMMNFLVAEEVSEEYIPLIMEELEFDGVDARDFDWGAAIAAEAKAEFHVIVIGGGMSGLLAAIRLSHAGIPYTVIEKNAGVGGTWFENRYPGCRVDVGNHFYSYSFSPSNEWTEFFAQQPELQAYFEKTMRDYGIEEHIRFETEVAGARWDDEGSVWLVDLTLPDGSTETVETNALISAVGQLNRPSLPDILGIDRFEGIAMHSAQWIDGTELTGKRVAVIGTGASAFQIVPTIAPEVEHLTVFQRSAPWMFPNPNYHEPVGPGVTWAVENLPYYGRWYRFLLFWPACDGGLIAMTADPDYADPENGISDINDAARDVFTQWMVDQVGDDEELAKKVVPDYVCLGKRTLQDNGSWLGALTRDNVDLVTDPIVEIGTDRIICESGAEHEVDIIVYATGFKANKYLWPMEIVGRGGATLRDQWGDEPQAYMGITIPNFPNLFCLYGPGTNLAHGGSLIFHSECQIRYVMGLLATLLAEDAGSVEVRQDVTDAYNDRMQEQLSKMVWTHPSIAHSWFMNDSGKIFVLSPWRLVDYWSWTREPDLAEFVLTR